MCSVASIAMVLHGMFGPALAPKNLATTLTWVQFRGVLVLVILGAGNFFCLACPFMLTRNLARRFFQPRFNWPRRLRNKWMAAGLFVAILFAYELFDLWSSPWWTAWLIVGYFLAVLAVDGVFKHASFCKFVCPIGQFNFVASLLSPLEVRVRNHETCSGCATRDCIRGKRGDAPQAPVLQRGCELALFQPLIVLLCAVVGAARCAVESWCGPAYRVDEDWPRGQYHPGRQLGFPERRARWRR